MNRLWVACVLLLALVSPFTGHAKSARTLYTEAKLRIASENLKRYEWARKERSLIVARADKWLKYDDAKLRTLVPPPGVPRAGRVHLEGCPVHGEAANKVGAYAWRISFDDPWKVRCPVGKEVYPSNDFAAFLASGMKDRSLLTGDYPDDGWGWQKPGVPKKFWFVAFYAQWSVSRFLHPALRDLSRAFLLTDDPRYAHACALLLWQLAEYYPRYQFEKQSRYGTEFLPWYKGRLLYHTWECFTVQTVAPAYDAIWPAIPNDAALAAIAKQSPREIREHIESRVLRTMAKDITDGTNRIQGNYGMHQVGAVRVAIVLDDEVNHPTKSEIIDWVLNNDRANMYTAMGLYDALFNLVHRDGYPFESPSYNCGWMRDLTHVAEALEDAGVPMFDHPRFRKLLSWPMKMLCAGEFTPPLGDSNNMFAGALGIQPLYCDAGFRRLRDPAFAKVWVQTGRQPKQDLFRECLSKQIAQAARTHPEPIGTQSSLLPGLGFATLQTGTDANRTAVAVFYGRYVGHAHYDRLHIDLYSHRNSLLPDFGYPETADTFDPRRYGFFSHNLAHNTVMVDSRRQASARGRLHVFDPGPFAQTVEVSAGAVYPDRVTLYRRTLMLVDAAPDQACLVDIFRVRGGQQHDWVVHGTQAEFRSDLPLSAVEAKGTLAGPDVPYGLFYDDPKLRDKPKGTVRYHLYEGSGFQFLFNVQRAKLHAVAHADWHLNRPEDLYPNHPTRGVVLRAHLIGKGEEALVCDGRPQLRRTWPETVKFLIRRRVGRALESAFVTVFEPYKNHPFVDSVRSLPVTPDVGMPVALEIRARGRRHVVFACLEAVGSAAHTIQLGDESLTVVAKAAVLSQDVDGKVVRAYLLDGQRAEWGGFVIEGEPEAHTRVAEVDYPRGRITLVDPALRGRSTAGGIAVVESAAHAAVIPVTGDAAASSFSVGDDDLCAARVAVRKVLDKGLQIYPRYAYWVEPGMTVINEAHRVLGRVRSFDKGIMQIDGGPYKMDDFPDVDRDGRRRISVMVVGPGDQITLHSSVRFLANPGRDR